MLLFIIRLLKKGKPRILIQIHLMLLFIAESKSVTTCLKLIQIHLMLLFITFDLFDILSLFLFKYISCYYLSLFAISNAPQILNSNTSHVIIYLSLKPSMYTFISYSNTSHVIIYLISPHFNKNSSRFKYISCYYLSHAGEHLHTEEHYSNTSHAIIYHVSYRRRNDISAIQIHLMLLFITRSANG